MTLTMLAIVALVALVVIKVLHIGQHKAAAKAAVQDIAVRWHQPSFSLPHICVSVCSKLCQCGSVHRHDVYMCYLVYDGIAGKSWDHQRRSTDASECWFVCAAQTGIGRADMSPRPRESEG
jgi:hypothetical protein